MGFAFRQGDIPAGQQAVPSLAGVQVTPKNAWPDGSLKFAIVAGRVPVAAAQPLALGFSAGTAPAGAALTLGDLKATGVTAAIACGAFGTARWAGADWDAPFTTWVSGPAMSSWIYRKPVGSDAHLVAWLELRLFAGGAVEVLPWIENGYLFVAGPTSKAATYTFTLGGSERFSAAIDLPHHRRTPLVSGSLLSHWLGPDPGIVTRPDPGYLQATELVPSYRATVPPVATIVRLLPATYTPLQQGNYPAGMGQTGYHPGIGLLPEWDVLYLTCADTAATLPALQRQAYSAGRYPLHYRDERTNRPIRFSQHPNVSVNSSTTNLYPPAATGTETAGWDVPHHPSVGFMAYMATGRWYHMETVQFAAAYNYLIQPNDAGIRGLSQGLFRSGSGAATVRGAAWAFRTLLHAATVTPDDDTLLRSEFIASLEANIRWNHGQYSGQAGNFGFVQAYAYGYGPNNDGLMMDATWQQDFYTAAWGYALAANPPIGAAARQNLRAFFFWKAQSCTGRLGGTGADEFLYRDAAPYTMTVARSDLPDYVGGGGPWFSDWGALYAANYGGANAKVAGDLRGGNFPAATSYWGNLLPAIAYAVRHGVPGASAAYARLTGAGNWQQLANAFDNAPVWGVRPANLP